MRGDWTVSSDLGLGMKPWIHGTHGSFHMPGQHICYCYCNIIIKEYIYIIYFFFSIFLEDLASLLCFVTSSGPHKIKRKRG